MTTVNSNIRINSARLWDSLEEMAKIGPGAAGGCNRQTLTDAERRSEKVVSGGVDVAGADIVNWNPQSRLLTVETADGAGPVTVTVTPAN